MQAFAVNHAMVVNLNAGKAKGWVTNGHTMAGFSNHKWKSSIKEVQSSKNSSTVEYQDLNWDTTMPEGTSMSGSQGLRTCFLQLDMFPTQNVEEHMARKWNAQEGNSISTMLSWPPSLPGLSPICSFWVGLKGRKYNKFVENLTQVPAQSAAIHQGGKKHILQATFNGNIQNWAHVIDLENSKTSY